MGRPILTRDINGTAVQALRPSGNVANITFSGVSASVQLPTGLITGEIVRVAATETCYIAFGGPSITATTSDILMPAGVEYFILPNATTHVAALQVTTSGVAQFMEAN
jgi:hypothetical protein